ncbi:hypothetical protein, variant 2 [Aphanomyces invadans]|uniref:Uncharacterized protein n=1 Tax=Aphanomyces invadans TaxID=157072 RepID=A0A024U1A0_9STRA|nr:hypothetical protein, variant 2 [Aphanomyces invadans]ETW00024.1 hypothetical protein, variant 2 [Aphanomyces invadans]|eukprot:XP_008871049.1 hypothetical protein, variant 2 [Aphanomyces invadans]
MHPNTRSLSRRARCPVKASIGVVVAAEPCVGHPVLDEHCGVHRLCPPSLGEAGMGHHCHCHFHDGTVSSFSNSILPLVVC